jgi:hypothetical protein
MIPAKADPVAQAISLQEVLEPRLEEDQAGERAVFFVDAAHFVFAPFLGFLWTVARVFLQALSGRQRFNVVGALNALTHELITVTNDSYSLSTLAATGRLAFKDSDECRPRQCTLFRA